MISLEVSFKHVAKATVVAYCAHSSHPVGYIKFHLCPRHTQEFIHIIPSPLSAFLLLVFLGLSSVSSQVHMSEKLLGGNCCWMCCVQATNS